MTSQLVILNAADLDDLHICGKFAQSLVEVVHLCQNAKAGNNREHVGRGVRELVVAIEGKFQCNSKGLDGHDRYRANGRTDGNVDKRVFLSVNRSNAVNHD